MAEQVSFYDRLKSELADDATTAFATDYDLGASDPETLRQTLAAKARQAVGSDNIPDVVGLVPQQIEMINYRLGQPEAMTDPSYRARLIQRRDEIANAARQIDFADERSVRRAESLIRSAGTRGVPTGQPLGPAQFYMGGASSPRVTEAENFIRRASDRIEGTDVSNPTFAGDRALSEAASDVRRGTDQLSEATMEASMRRQQENDLLRGMTRDERALARRGFSGGSPQLDLYRDTKNLVERNAGDVIRAGKRALSSPAVKRGLGVAAGLMGSKIATAATSGGADLVQELAFGAPAAFIQGYNRSQEPYEQVKYVAEEMGPIDNLQRMSLDALSYDDVVRLRQEGHLTPKAQQQYRQHVIKTEGFDPDEVYRRQ